MRDAKDVLPKVIADLESTGVDFALVGALAIGVRAEERFTKDLDFVLSVPDQEGALAVVRHLRGRLGYRSPTPFTEYAADFRGVSLLPPDVESAFPVDILWNVCGIEREVVERAEPLEFIPGVWLRVATRADLIAMKVLSLKDAGRPRDRGDLAALLKEATSLEVDEARRALELMEERGMELRLGKDDLVAEFEDALALYAPELSLDRDLERDR